VVQSQPGQMVLGPYLDKTLHKKKKKRKKKRAAGVAQ
jgi:hypothetical protein